MAANTSGLSAIVISAAGEDQALALLREQAEDDAEAGQNERELANLRKTRTGNECRVERIAKGEHQRERGDRVAHHDDGDRGQHLQRFLHQYLRLEQHADGNEEQHRESVAQRQRLFSGPVAEFRLAHQHPGEECSERK